MRVSLLAVIGLVLGAAIGGIIANVSIPSHEQMRRFAADLVPPVTVMTNVGEISGLEMLVGRYEAVAGFDSQGAEVTAVADTLRDHAVELGWTLVRTEPTPAGVVQYWKREQADATVHVRNLESSEDGTIFVHYQESPTDRFLIGLALGGAAGLVAAFLRPRFVQQPGQRRHDGR